MMKRDLIAKNPLRIINPDIEGNSYEQRLGLVIARAGLGKTAILVQIALDSLMRGNNVLHVSIGQNLEKTRRWYDNILKDILQQAGVENGAEIDEKIRRQRLIMTFNESSFSRPKLEERLNDIVCQNIFKPDCLVIDGFDFADSNRQTLTEMHDLMKTMHLQVWFSCVSHREDTRTSPIGVPAPCHEMDDLFDIIILLQTDSEKKCTTLNIVKDGTGCADTEKILCLDPSTLMIKEV